MLHGNNDYDLKLVYRLIRKTYHAKLILKGGNEAILESALQPVCCGMKQRKTMKSQRYSNHAPSVF
eukprot:172842-Pelagomonas_calceolata.AAC.3